MKNTIPQQNHYWRKKLKKELLHTALAIGLSILLGIGLGRAFYACTRHTAQTKGTAEVSQTIENAEEAADTIKKVALTFDDGPNPQYTKKLLEGLKKRDVKATFFVLGEEAEYYPEILRETAEDGHLIGVHSYKHVNLSQLSDEQAREQVDRTNEVIHELTGKYANYIRPPFGCWKEDLDYESRMIEVLWDVDPRDWATDSSDMIVNRVLRQAKDGSIILLHDASASSVQAAFTIIDVLKQQGYEFVTVEDLIME